VFNDREFRKLFENAPIGLAVCDMEGKLMLVNQAFASILGRSIEETLRLEYWHITPKEYEKQEKEQLEELKKNGRYGPYEKHYIRNDKEKPLVPVRLNGCAVSIDNCQYIWSAVERLEMPIHSVMLFKEAPVGLALCRLDGQLVAVNQAYADLIGRSIEETLKLDYWQITPRHFKAKEDEQIKKIKAERKYGPYQKKYIHKDGRLIDVVLVGKLLPINGEDFIWSVCQEGEVFDIDIDPESALPLSQGLIFTELDPKPIRPTTDNVAR